MWITIASLLHAYLFGCAVHFFGKLFNVNLDVPSIFGQVKAFQIYP
jgi:hypothetical protein